MILLTLRFFLMMSFRPGGTQNKRRLGAVVSAGFPINVHTAASNGPGGGFHLCDKIPLAHGSPRLDTGVQVFCLLKPFDPARRLFHCAGNKRDIEQPPQIGWLSACRKTRKPNSTGRKGVCGKPRKGFLRHFNHKFSELF